VKESEVHTHTHCAHRTGLTPTAQAQAKQLHPPLMPGHSVVRPLTSAAVTVAPDTSTHRTPRAVAEPARGASSGGTVLKLKLAAAAAADDAAAGWLGGGCKRSCATETGTCEAATSPNATAVRCMV